VREARISPAVLGKQAVYVQGWLAKLRNDRRMVVIAAAQAQRAADFILNVATPGANRAHEREGGPSMLSPPADPHLRVHGYLLNRIAVYTSMRAAAVNRDQPNLSNVSLALTVCIL
jgi:hypothetical protein